MALDLIAKYLPANAYILEAGASNGDDTVRLANRFPGSLIFAFEPEPVTGQQMRNKVKNLRNVRPFSVALGTENATKVPFFVSNQYCSSSLQAPEDLCKNLYGLSFKPITVDVMTLDTWAAGQKVDHIDFMWLDMQGGEYPMLKASKTILPTVKVIYLEVSHVPLYKDSGLFPEVKQFLESHNFDCLFMEDDHKGIYGNALFVKKGLVLKEPLSFFKMKARK